MKEVRGRSRYAIGAFGALVFLVASLPAAARADGRAPKPRGQRPPSAHDVCSDARWPLVRCHAEVSDQGPSDPTPDVTTGPRGLSPAGVKAAYGFPTESTAGVGQTIAIVDAFDDPTAEKDLAQFS